MSLAVDDFWCHVLYRATEGKRLLLVEDGLFAQAEVCQFYMTVGIQQNTAQ